LDAEFLGIRCQIQSKMTPNKNSILTAEIISNSLVFSPRCVRQFCRLGAMTTRLSKKVCCTPHHHNSCWNKRPASSLHHKSDDNGTAHYSDGRQQYKSVSHPESRLGW
jgi:hypothetical protein